MTIIKIAKEPPFEGMASINNLHAALSETLILAVRQTSAAMRAAGIRHVLVGGVAVSCNGYSRSTVNIDWAVEKCAFIYQNRFTFLRPELPVKFLGIPIHYVTPTDAFEQMMLEKYLTIPAPGEVPVLQIGPLVVMKLIGQRHKDRTDLVELFKRRLTELPYVREFVASNLPSQIAMLNELIVYTENELSVEGTP